MSNSLLLPSSLLFFLLIGIASGQNLGVIPAESLVFIKEGETSCINYVLQGSSNTIAIDILWSDKKFHLIDEYTSAKNERVLVSYSRMLFDKKSTEICFYGVKKGTYYGVVIFEQIESNLVLGSWVTLEVWSPKQEEKGSVITGFSISEKDNIALLGLGVILGLLVVLLLMLLLVLKRKKFTS